MMLVRPLKGTISLASRGFVLRRRGLRTSHVCWASKKVLHTFKLADIGEGITECEVVKWNVSESSRVANFDPLCEVTSDKAAVEITSPFDGVVKELLVKEGEIAKVGQGLCLIEAEEDLADEAPSEPAPLDAAASLPGEPQPLELRHAVSGTAPSESLLHPLDPSNVASVPLSRRSTALATPSIRHLARQHGVDLELLMPGSGKSGRIEKRDVEAHMAAKGQQATNTQPHAVDGDLIVGLGRTRYSMWKAMRESLEIPHFGYSTSLDLTSIHAILPSLNAYIPEHFLPHSTPPRPQFVSPTSVLDSHAAQLSPPEVPEGGHYSRLTYMPYLLKTLSKAMTEWPLFRSSITPMPASSDAAAPPKPTLTIRPHPAISVALSTPSGLYTPTLTSLHTSSIYSIASSLSRLAFLGRQVPCGLSVREMPKSGGTITVSNVGAIGRGEWASPVLVPGGGVAIVAIGRASWFWDADTDADADLAANGVAEGMIKVKRRLRVGVSWSADHRVVEGAELAAFVECWRAWVENPARLVAEGI